MTSVVDSDPMRARFDDVVAQLSVRWPESRIEPSLSRVTALLDLLGDPQRSYPVITVTGTNGKSSTARMIASLLRALGLRTGVFTSPHLIDPTERIEIDGEPIDQDTFVRIWEEIAPFAEMVDVQSAAEGGVALSFFEVITAMGYAAFADAPVDVAVIEVGMGGTWDATSVAPAQVAVVLTVDLEAQTIKGPDGGTIRFEVEPFRKHCLLNGLDDIGLTLEKAQDINSFEAADQAKRPWLYQQAS